MHPHELHVYELSGRARCGKVHEMADGARFALLVMVCRHVCRCPVPLCHRTVQCHRCLRLWWPLMAKVQAQLLVVCFSLRAVPWLCMESVCRIGLCVVAVEASDAASPATLGQGNLHSHGLWRAACATSSAVHVGVSQPCMAASGTTGVPAADIGALRICCFLLRGCHVLRAVTDAGLRVTRCYLHVG